MDNKKLIIIIFIIVLLNMIFFLEFTRMQMRDLYKNADNIASSIEYKLETTKKVVQYLHLTAQYFISHKENIKLEKALQVHYVSDDGSYALDGDGNRSSQVEANLLGFGKDALSDKKILKEMEAALQLTPFLKLIYTKNKSFAWVYYYSKNHFTVLYPYVSSKDFKITPDLEKKPFFYYAVPKVNPQKKLFFTPLYMDAIGKGLMVTVGKPLYVNNEFFGTINIDITLNYVDNLLSHLDAYDNQSAVYNDKKQIFASNNFIKDFDRSRIYKIDKFIGFSLFDTPDTVGTMKFVQSKYVYVKTLSDTQFRFIYIADVYNIWIKSFLYVLPVFLLMLLSLYLVFLYYLSKKINEKLKFQTVNDYMTGAYNRRYFFEVAQALFLRAERKNSKLAAIMLDIDDFKRINDTYGHDVGDIAIIEVRKILERNLRRYDLFARFGGEEFCILLDEISKEDVIQLCEKIRKDFEENKIVIDDITIHYTVSMGIAYGMMSSLEKLIKAADEALYESKQNGKNKVTIYEV